MEQTHIIHIVDGCCRSRAEQARLIFSNGHHCEVYSDADELVRAAPRRGIVLVRDDDGARGAADLVAKLGRAGMWLPVVATALNPGPDEVVGAIKSGALDYLALPLRADRLGDTLRRIESEAVAYAETRRKAVEASSRVSALTAREREVLRWLAEGRSNKMIARELAISPRTVEIHRANMMAKLGAQHAVEAVRVHLEAGLTRRPVLRVA